MTLNNEQNNALEFVKLKKNLFITSKGAGCGKTFLLNKIIDDFSSFWKYNKNVSVTATTGVAALLLKGGQTIHSWAGIGTGEHCVDRLYQDIIKSKAKLRWENTDILIIDEISLMSPELFDKLENLACLIRNNDKPFGGIQIIVSGDWLQLPNICNSQYTFQSKNWNKCIDKIIYLTNIMRQKNLYFQKILNFIRIGDINDEVKTVLLSRVNKKLNNTDGIIPTRLFCTNTDIDRININEFKKLTKTGNKIHTFKIKWKYKYNYHSNYIKYLKNCNFVENLELCVGCQVMLLTNISIDDELVNGSRGIIESFNKEGKPCVKFLNGMTIEIDFKKQDIEVDKCIIGTFYQIPLRLAYASSIHKMQGSTLDYVIINLEKVFEVSQGYVGLSRVKDLENLSIENINFNKLIVNKSSLQFYQDLEKNI